MCVGNGDFHQSINQSLKLQTGSLRLLRGISPSFPENSDLGKLGEKAGFSNSDHREAQRSKRVVFVLITKIHRKVNPIRW